MQLKQWHNLKLLSPPNKGKDSRRFKVYFLLSNIQSWLLLFFSCPTFHRSLFIVLSQTPVFALKKKKLFIWLCWGLVAACVTPASFSCLFSALLHIFRYQGVISFKNLFIYIYFYLFIWLFRVLIVACRIFSCLIWTLRFGLWNLVSWPGIEPGPPALGARSLSHWTTRNSL